MRLVGLDFTTTYLSYQAIFGAYCINLGWRMVQLLYPCLFYKIINLAQFGRLAKVKKENSNIECWIISENLTVNLSLSLKLQDFLFSEALKAILIIQSLVFHQ